MLNPNLFKQCRLFAGALVLAFGLMSTAGAQMGSITPPSIPPVALETRMLGPAEMALISTLTFEANDGTSRVIRDAIDEALDAHDLIEEKAELNLAPADK